MYESSTVPQSKMSQKGGEIEETDVVSRSDQRGAITETTTQAVVAKDSAEF